MASLSFLLLAIPTLGAAGDKLLLSDLTLDRDAEGLYVTMRVEGAFNPEVREVLHSGVPLSFQYSIRVRRKRPLWFDLTVLSRQIETQAKLDVLTREFTLAQTLDGEVLEVKTTRDPAVAMEYMTHLKRLRIGSEAILESDGAYDLLAKAKVLDEFVLYVIPWPIETPWQRRNLLATPSPSP